MKKIFVPTDFSPASKKAADYAVAFAELFNSKVILMHAYPPLMYDPDIAFIHEEALGKIKELEIKRLESEKKRLDKKLKVNASSVFVQGLTKPTILLAIKKSHPELGIMGTTGASDLEKNIFGSVSLEVVNECNTTVLIVPEKAKLGKIKRIVYATDYHESDIKAIGYLVVLAKKLNARVAVVHVANNDFSSADEKESMEALKIKIAEKNDCKDISFHIRKGEHVAGEIEKFCKKENADLLAVNNEKRSFFIKILLPSITKKMIYHSEIPLLVFAEKE